MASSTHCIRRYALPGHQDDLLDKDKLIEAIKRINSFASVSSIATVPLGSFYGKKLFAIVLPDPLACVVADEAAHKAILAKQPLA